MSGGYGGVKLLPLLLAYTPAGEGSSWGRPQRGRREPRLRAESHLKAILPPVVGEGRELHLSVQIDEPTRGAEGFWHRSSHLQRVSVMSPQRLHQSEERACVP